MPSPTSYREAARPLRQAKKWPIPEVNCPVNKKITRGESWGKDPTLVFFLHPATTCYAQSLSALQWNDPLEKRALVGASWRFPRSGGVGKLRMPRATAQRCPVSRLSSEGLAAPTQRRKGRRGDPIRYILIKANPDSPQLMPTSTSKRLGINFGLRCKFFSSQKIPLYVHQYSAAS